VQCFREGFGGFAVDEDRRECLGHFYNKMNIKNRLGET
jgi:hypothetical protein